MLAADDTILYVGKARHLKNRVSSYFQRRAHAEKTQAMVAQVARVEITVTASETEALLLEYNLIKQHRPRYNVLLKDDKSFPYIHLTAHEFPRLAYYRGAGKVPGRFFGPYPNSVAARETLQFLQKLFRLRPCEDTFFANRSRPCLQHQIGRCSAPCVGLVTREAYAQDIADAVQVLQGRNNELIADLGRRMESAAEHLQYEAAARFRDQIAMLKQIQASQAVTRIRGADIDAVAIAGNGPEYCVSVVFVRGGRNLGSTNFFPEGRPRRRARGAGGVPRPVLPRPRVAGRDPRRASRSRMRTVLEAALRERAGRSVPIRSGVRGTRARWLDDGATNAELGPAHEGVEPGERARATRGLAGRRWRWSACRSASSASTSATPWASRPVASCVVFGAEGPLKSDYRRFNLKGLTPGDDFAGMRQAVGRHFARVQKGESPMPDVLLIDGGEGQLQAAREALGELGIAGLATVGVAKGADRRVGPGATVLGRSGHPPYTRGGLCGVAIDPARARRSPPLRHRRTSQGAGRAPGSNRSSRRSPGSAPRSGASC